MYRTLSAALLALAVLALGSIAQPVAAAEPAPLTFADFVGTWHHHGYALTIYPDGSAVAVWRTYDGDAPDAPGGQASITFTRVEGRTLYGTNPNSATRAVVALTEYDHGIGFLADGADAVATTAPYEPRHGVTLCGPRYESAPDWFRATSPCGA